MNDRLLVGVELGSGACLVIGAATSPAPWLAWVVAGGLGLFGAWKAAR